MSKADQPPPYNPQAPAGQPYLPPQQPPYPGYPPPGQQYPPPGQPVLPQGPPYPQAGPYPPPGQQQSTVVVASPAVVVPQMILGDIPVQMTCPNCQANIVTATTYETGTLTWIIAGGLCLFGFWLCACIPFCVDACKDVMHTCPSCTRVIGIHKRIS